jgi:hypothetical protein
LEGELCTQRSLCREISPAFSLNCTASASLKVPVSNSRVSTEVVCRECLCLITPCKWEPGITFIPPLSSLTSLPPEPASRGRFLREMYWPKRPLDPSGIHVDPDVSPTCLTVQSWLAAHYASLFSCFWPRRGPGACAFPIIGMSDGWAFWSAADSISFRKRTR